MSNRQQIFILLQSGLDVIIKLQMLSSTKNFNRHLLWADGTQNALPSQIPNRCTQPKWHFTIKFKAGENE